MKRNFINRIAIAGAILALAALAVCSGGCETPASGTNPGKEKSTDGNSSLTVDVTGLDTAIFVNGTYIGQAKKGQSRTWHVPSGTNYLCISSTETMNGDSLHLTRDNKGIDSAGYFAFPRNGGITLFVDWEIQKGELLYEAKVTESDTPGS